ncbi:hypothetical protein, partial [Klebsiella variicola]|uniref:hypothetical protein n=1 Tax=Klebsiella variicola TaxID=244366 RepID=UPI0027309165
RFLTQDPCTQCIGKTQDGLVVLKRQLLDRDTGPGADDLCHQARAYIKIDQRLPVLVREQCFALRSEGAFQLINALP